MNLLLSSLALLVIGQVPTEGRGPMPLFDEHRPPKYAALPGKAIGLLVWQAEDVLATEGRTVPPGTVLFARGLESYRLLYVPRPDDPEADDLTFKTAAGREQKFARVSLATADMLKSMKLSGSVRLVEVEVNGGAGSAAEEGFVATALRRLDGTADYPLAPATVLADIRKRYQAQLAEKKNAIAEGMEKARLRLNNNAKPTGPREQKDMLLATWLPDAERLRIEIITQISDGYYVKGQGAKGPADNPGQRTGQQFGVRGGMVFEIDKTGRTVAATARDFVPYTRQLAPPK